MIELETIRWKQIAAAIEDDACVLFIGPGATTNYNAPKRQAEFMQNLADRHTESITAYHADDGFLLFKNKTERNSFLSDIRDFYQGQMGNVLLDQIAQIPFHVIVSVTPDIAINHSFAKQRFPFTHQYYTAKVKEPHVHKPTKSDPLIYNLLGCIKETESLITSHLDLFDLLQSIYGDHNLPDGLISLFGRDHIRQIIFLGFEFEKWYFQLILHLLRININESKRYAAVPYALKKENKTLYESQFKINFVDSDLDSFVQMLKSQFEPGALRQPNVRPTANRQYLLPNITKAVGASFLPTRLEFLCMTTFERVFQDFTPEMGQLTRIQKLVAYCHQQGLLSLLLDEIKKENPYQYEACGPFYES